jgi:hypothetical protein
MPSQLDLDNPIVTKDQKATAYFEDIIFGLFQVTNQSPIDVSIESGVATIHLSLGSQFNIVADDDFEIDILDVATPANRKVNIDITNPAGAYDLTDITAPVGVTVYKTAGSTISILGADNFSFQVIIPNDEKVNVLPFEMEPV